MKTTALPKALVIEDEEAIRSFVTYALESEGYAVTACGSCAEGLQKFHEGGYSVVVTDIMLPDRDGIEAIIEMRRLHPQPAIVAMSGVGSRDRLLGLARMFEADAAIEKPFTVPQLIKAVSEAVRCREERLRRLWGERWGA